MTLESMVVAWMFGDTLQFTSEPETSFYIKWSVMPAYTPAMYPTTWMYRRLHTDEPVPYIRYRLASAPYTSVSNTRL